MFEWITDFASHFSEGILSIGVAVAFGLLAIGVVMLFATAIHYTVEKLKA